MNRKQRRALLHHLADIEIDMAVDLFFDADGKTGVQSDTAKAVLRKAMRRMVRVQQTEVVLQISPEQATAFPGIEDNTNPGRWFCAVGFDIGGYATYRVAKVDTPHA